MVKLVVFLPRYINPNAKLAALEFSTILFDIVLCNM